MSIRKRDLLWLCNVTGQVTLERKDAEMFSIIASLSLSLPYTHTHTQYNSHISFRSSIHHSMVMNLFSGNASCLVLLSFFFFFFLLIVPYRDQGAADKMNPFAEQEAWEEHQIGELKISILFVHHLIKILLCDQYSNSEIIAFAGKATMKYGSKNKKQISDDYQYVYSISTLLHHFGESCLHAFRMFTDIFFFSFVIYNDYTRLLS